MNKNKAIDKCQNKNGDFDSDTRKRDNPITLHTYMLLVQKHTH